MKNRLGAFKKVCGFVLSVVLSFNLVGMSAEAYTELTAKPGYLIDYHNEHKYSEYGQTIDEAQAILNTNDRNSLANAGYNNTQINEWFNARERSYRLHNCDNFLIENPGRECKQILMAHLSYDYVNSYDPSGREVYGVHRTWSGGIPTSASDSRWAECLEEFGCYAMPLSSGGCAYLCIDDTVMYIAPEDLYGHYDGTFAGVYDPRSGFHPSFPYFGGWEQHCRLYYVYPTVEDCTDSKNFKFVKAAYYYYSGDGKDGANQMFNFKIPVSSSPRSNNFKNLSYECWDTWDAGEGRNARRWIMGGGNLNIEETQTGRHPDTGATATGSPSYLVARLRLEYFQTGYCRTLGKDSISFNSDGTLYNYGALAVAGFPLRGHREMLQRQRCCGHYRPVVYTVVYNGNGATSGSVDNQYCVYDATYNTRTNGFSYPGYLFKGWNTASDGSGTWYAEGVEFSNLATTEGAVVNLYAQWEGVKYNVEVYNNKPSEASGNIGNIK